MEKACLHSIKSKYERFTKTEKKIADFVLKNSEKTVNLTADELASIAGCAKSAIVRFCKTAGFDGFSKLKLSLAVELSKNKKLNFVPYIYPEDNASDILDKVFSANVKTLHDTAEKIDRQALQAVVDLLADAKNVYIYGVGTSAVVVNDFQYRLMNLGYNATSFTDVVFMKTSAMNVKKGDVAIGISHSGRTVATVDALKLAAENGAKTVCITSFADSPIAKACDLPIEIFSDEIQYPVEATSARIAHFSVIDTITVALSAKDYEEAYERSVKTRELINSIRY
ncbi:MAG: MurR/RpiR family transcriptional regulator [Clostridia bacterium]|nr:MurR/RpiR family transcriptional regulator [Clostridia bacterium]